ncbi:hypothetical protein [Crateriforma conspicua]|nr:hypothetical protein [Crateriforma conspicua]
MDTALGSRAATLVTLGKHNPTQFCDLMPMTNSEVVIATTLLALTKNPVTTVIGTVLLLSYEVQKTSTRCNLTHKALLAESMKSLSRNGINEQEAIELCRAAAAVSKRVGADFLDNANSYYDKPLEQLAELSPAHRDKVLKNVRVGREDVSALPYSDHENTCRAKARAGELDFD